MSDIHSKLAKIQGDLKAPKGQTNTFGKYKYRNCEDILEALKPLMAGGSLTLSDSVELVGDRVYVKATATYQHGQESVSVTAYAREAQTKKGMDDAQITGAASSYARKYALNGLFMIDDTKDADSVDNSGNVQLTDTDKQWIAAARQDVTVLEQIADSAYKALIMEQLK